MSDKCLKEIGTPHRCPSCGFVSTAVVVLEHREKTPDEKLAIARAVYERHCRIALEKNLYPAGELHPWEQLTDAVKAAWLNYAEAAIEIIDGGNL